MGEKGNRLQEDGLVEVGRRVPEVAFLKAHTPAVHVEEVTGVFVGAEGQHVLIIRLGGIEVLQVFLDEAGQQVGPKEAGPLVETFLQMGLGVGRASHLQITQCQEEMGPEVARLQPQGVLEIPDGLGEVPLPAVLVPQQEKVDHGRRFELRRPEAFAVGAGRVAEQEEVAHACRRW